MAQLRLFVFGPPRLERGGEVVELGLRRAVALLVYLAVTGQPQSRDALATLLWPESDQREARANLRRTLHRLGQAIGEDLLATSAEMVSIAPGAALWVDSLQFLQLAGPAGRLAEAVALYGDDFLAGFSLPDSPAFDEWQFFERERLRQLLARSLELLTREGQARGAWGAAAEHARRWAALDPLHEPAQRALLEAYAQAGQPAAALRQYQELARALEAELGAEPEEATRALYEAIRTRRFPPAPSPEAAPAAGTPATAAGPPAALPAAPPLVGRERELEEILGLLAEGGAPRLVTLTGPGGAGKTRLAQAVAEQAAARFADGACLIPLAEVAAPGGVLAAIAAGLGVTAAGGDAEAQLTGFLRGRELLLVLDNVEHLLEGAPQICALLAAAPRVRVLATSRERLDAAGEAVYQLRGLALPADDAGADALEAASARLLLQRAQLVRPELAPGPEDRAAIARICRLVQGMPLALTLAASWAELLSFAEIAEEIARSLDFLSTEQHDVPERQRSVRAVFESSWGRLPADAQRVFARLTVFRGGFTRRAAEAVAGAALHTLRRLVSASFITLSADAQRYEIHELLRQIAAEAAGDAPEQAVARDRHAAYYLGQVRDLTASLKGPGQLQAVAALRAEADNLWAAWRHAVAQGDRGAIAGAAEGLWLLCEVRGLLLEGEGLMREAAEALGPGGEAAEPELAGLLRAAQGHLAARRGGWAEGSATMERGVAMLRAGGAARPTWLALALLQLGFLCRFQERYAEAERLGEESLALYAAADDRWGVAYSLLLMGTALERQGKPALAAQLLQACLERARELGDGATRSFAAWNLGRAHASFGAFAQARRFLDEGVGVAEELGHTLSLANGLMERGLVALTTGAAEQAERDLAASAAHFAAVGAAWEEKRARAELGAASLIRGDLDRAEALLSAGLAAARATGARWHAARFLSYLGLVAHERCDLTVAAALQREALGIMRDAGHEPRVARGAVRLARALLEQDPRSDEARGLLHEALTLGLRHQLAPTILEACAAAAPLVIGAGRLDEALESLALVEGHPSATHEARLPAGRARQRCAAELGPERSAVARERGQQRDWRAVAQQLAGALAGGARRAGAAPPTNLDPHLPPLIGRDWELTAVLAMLGESTRRPVTLLGPGGIGKTRLAQEAALVALDAFPDGAFFVPLAPVADPGQLAAAIAEQLGLRLSGGGEPEGQLLEHVRGRQMLLVLDNIEHLLERAALIPEILTVAPKTAILATSRERLGLDGELVYTLGGIEVPEDEADGEALERGAVRLLLERVRAARPGYDPGPAELDAMIRIARLVQGMPLALILAASWADMLSLEEIAGEVERSLDFLEADLRALPPRQRSVRAVFEASWRRLQPETQRAFCRMSVFRGGFSRRAAARVAGADLRTLRALVNSSFVTLDDDGHCSVHELLRQFGAERLDELGEGESLRDRHSAHYLDGLAAWEGDLRGRRQVEAFGVFERNLDNIRQAWGWAVERGDAAAIGRALDSLFLFSEKRGRFQEGADLLQRARDRLAPAPEGDGGLWGRLTARLSILRSRSPRERQVPPAEVERWLAAAGAAGDRAEEALAGLALGVYYARTENDYGRALQQFERALRLHRALGDHFYVAEGLARVGICHGYLGDTRAFYERCSEGYAVAESAGDLVGMVTAQANLSEALLHLGRYADVVERTSGQIAMARSLGMRSSENTALAYAALAQLLVGELGEARRLAVEAHRMSGETSNALCAGLALGVLSLQASLAGDYGLGARFAAESLAQPLNLLAQVQTHWGLALARIGEGDDEGAGRSLAAADEAAGHFASPAPRLWLAPVAAVLAARRGDAGRAAELLAQADGHPLAARGWMGRWPPLTELRAALRGRGGAGSLAA